MNSDMQSLDLPSERNDQLAQYAEHHGLSMQEAANLLVKRGLDDAVTKRVADMLWHEFSIEVEDHGIEVVDMASEDVHQL